MLIQQDLRWYSKEKKNENEIVIKKKLKNIKKTKKRKEKKKKLLSTLYLFITVLILSSEYPSMNPIGDKFIEMFSEHTTQEELKTITREKWCSVRVFRYTARPVSTSWVMGVWCVNEWKKEKMKEGRKEGRKKERKKERKERNMSKWYSNWLKVETDVRVIGLLIYRCYSWWRKEMMGNITPIKIEIATKNVQIVEGKQEKI